MNKDKPYLIHKASELSRSHLENVYVVYKPKIIKFAYQPDISLQDTSKQVQQNKKSTFTKLTSSKATYKAKELHLLYSKNQKRTITPKIKLVSRRTTEIQSQQDNKSVNDSNCSQRDQQKKLKRARKLKTYSALDNSHYKSKIDLKKHISHIPIPKLTCDLFAGCTQPIQDRRFQYVNQDVQNIQSRLIILDVRQQEISIKKGTFSSENMKAQKGSNLNDTFKERKRIFDKSYRSRLTNLHKSFGCHNQSRSRSRKSIFQHYNIKNRSLSQDLSFFKRKRIFQPRNSQAKIAASTLLKQQKIDRVKIDQIPFAIFTTWIQKIEKNNQSNYSFLEKSYISKQP